jgi:nucleoside-diphosphate-sugar epimerase
MTVILSGARGFLGSAMAARWNSLGCEVRDTGTLRFGDALPSPLLAGAGAFVHAAHDFGREQETIEGTQQWLREARQAGVKRQIFLSSYSAHADALSKYGTCKFALERFVLDNGGIVVRPGLVAGPGGMFARMARSLLRWRLAPLVRPDVRNVAVISLDTFLSALLAIAERGEPGSAWNLFATDLLTQREFAQAVWRARNVRGMVCDVPSGVAQAVLRAAGAHRMLDSLRGQLAAPPHRSDIARWLDTPPLNAHEAVGRAVQDLL